MAYTETEEEMLDNKINGSNVQREEPSPEEAVKQFVSKWQSTIRAAKKHFDKDFIRPKGS